MPIFKRKVNIVSHCWYIFDTNDDVRFSKVGDFKRSE